MKMRWNRLWLVGLCYILTSCGGDNSVTPPAGNLQISSITPSTVSPGSKSVTLTISGAGFSGGTFVDFGSDIKVINKRIISSEAMEVVTNISPSARTGSRTAIVLSSGMSAHLENALSISENKPPLAHFLISPSQGTVESIFQLDAAASKDEDGEIVDYKWEISDGTNPKGIRVNKQFSSIGIYSIRLILTDDDGDSSSTERILEVGANIPPNVSFTITPRSGDQLTEFTFDASATTDIGGTILSYVWELGNNEARGRLVTHTFDTGGLYQISLKVRDSNEVIAVARQNLTVRYFDIEEAKKQIRQAVIDFLVLFQKVADGLSAEELVVGFSSNCEGRAKEIRIIQRGQSNLETLNVEILEEPLVFHVTNTTARANIKAKFSGTLTDGTTYENVATHHFSLVNENGVWKLCDFFLTDSDENELIDPNGLFAH